jgi:hypothetical protein
VRGDISPLDNDGLMQAIVDAINSLEENGYVAPYVCIFGRKPFEAAFKPINNSTVLPRDRIEPLIGRELLHASGIDVPPQRRPTRLDEDGEAGVLLSMADEPIDPHLPPKRHRSSAGGLERPLCVFRLRALCPGIATPRPLCPCEFRRPWGRFLCQLLTRIADMVQLAHDGLERGTGRRMRRRPMGRPSNAKGSRSRWVFGPPIPRTR